ncbi:MAG: DUF433 domain-containing protein [Chthonomonadales bacterium]|nr:DUF433 domain-containing protein [Chthonomonadales bacterium]
MPQIYDNIDHNLCADATARCLPGDEIMENRLSRNTSRPDVYSGQPIIRDMRISVEMMLGQLEQGETEVEMLADIPELEPQGISTYLSLGRYAAMRFESLERKPLVGRHAVIRQSAAAMCSERLERKLSCPENPSGRQHPSSASVDIRSFPWSARSASCLRMAAIHLIDDESEGSSDSASMSVRRGDGGSNSVSARSIRMALRNFALKWVCCESVSGRKTLSKLRTSVAPIPFQSA